MPRLSKIGAAALAAFGWTSGSSVTASYLVVAGGGGGAGGIGGGGGAGGYRTGTASLNPTLSYTVTVGAGGAGAVASTSTRGNNGSDSIFSATTSTGGGGGGTVYGGLTGASGGSGGGGGADGTTTNAGGSGNTPSTSPSQGNNGGSGQDVYSGGGGGGASAVGARNGGAGTANSISGSSVTYAGGGGAGARSDIGGTAGSGGSGGGGNGSGTVNGSPGTANLGGGGGGGSFGVSYGGNGGSGVVIISYLAPQKFSGGIVTLSGGNVIHTFNTSGTLGPITTLSASYLIVAGGGGGGYDVGGGGGAGGLLSGSSLTIDPNSTYLVTVGAGGTGATSSVNGVNGSNSTFSMVSTAAVGGGGGASASNTAGSSGGSGGGGTRLSGSGGTGGSGTSGQGNAGGSGSPSSGANVSAAGGGGGAGAVGANASNGVGGNGGIGSTSSISGTSTYYAGGGGGRADGTGTQGTGGSGGGGSAGSAGTAGTANTGGGGGGGSTSGGGNGGSGVVIISYPGSTQQMAGGTVTITGGNVIHTFTSTGYLAPLKLVNNSLRFRSSASAYLNRTPSVAGNRKTWTFSTWVKRANIGTTSEILGSYGTDNNTNFAVEFSGDNLYVGLYSIVILQTTAVYRDPAAWYHIVVSFDSTQATASNRVSLYVNGVQVTAFGTDNRSSITQNGDYGINSTNVHNIGRNPVLTSRYFDGYLTEVNLIDGQALPPTAFGTFNSYGVWQPITYGGSYGTNGFYLPFNAKTSSYVGSFNGSNQYLSIASNAAFNQSGDFTIEYYANLTSNTNYQVVVGRGTGFITIQHSSDANNMIRLVRYGQATLATGGNVTAGKWNHFAIVRSGSTVSGYLNGVLVATATDSTSTATGNALAIGQNSDGTNYFTGQISNVRYTNTAVYTSNFTPSTSALTAVSGTQLLTLQNSSIVDNSTNALSITNNNGVSTGQTYPFAYGIFNDQGPAGNNWTPNNVSGAFGTTLDYMTDVPTLTSATAANYAVLNPLAYGSTGTSTINNGNLSFSNPSAHASTTSTIGVTSGKYYLECTVTTSNPLGLGITTSTVPYSAYPGAVTGLWWVYDNTGTFQINNQTSTPYSGSSKVAINQIWQIALDMDNGKAWFGINNTWYDSTGGTTGNPSTGANATFSSLPTTSPMFFFIEVAGAVWAATFGQRPYNYTPPTNFVGLNTYNL